MSKVKKIVITIAVVLIMLAITTGLAYALKIFEGIGGENSIKTGKVAMSYSESSNVISIDNALPVTDEVGKAQTDYFEFTVTSNADTNSDDSEGIKIPYSLIIEPKAIDSDKESFENSAIKVYLTKVNGSSEDVVVDAVKLSELTNVDTNFKIYSTQNVHKNGSGAISTKYRLRAWIDYGVDTSSWQEGAKQKQYKFAVNVNATGELNVPPTGAETLISKVGTGGLVAEEHPETNQLAATTDYRYTGKNPDNYVSFNDELWRIIGVFDVDDGTGKLKKRIKIIGISLDPFGYLQWDSRSNNWTTSSGMELLNSGDYWNRTGDYSSNGLINEAKLMIDDAKWYLGGTHQYTSTSAIQFYNYERGPKAYGSNPTSWVGKVGLMYPSDYGYATSGGTTTNRDVCLAKEMYKWNDSEISDCKNNDWLLDSSNQWTLMPDTFSSELAFYVNSLGHVDYYEVYNYDYVFRPCVYLSSDIKITGGLWN